jgi:hypothetical protein
VVVGTKEVIILSTLFGMKELSILTKKYQRGNSTNLLGLYFQNKRPVVNASKLLRGQCP